MNPGFSEEEIRAWAGAKVFLKNAEVVHPDAIDLQRFVYYQNLKKEVEPLLAEV